MPPLLPHILHTKIVTFVIFPATTEQHGERNFVRIVISSRRYAILRQRLVVRLKPAASVAKDGLPVGTGNLAAEVRTQASPRAGFKVELLPHIGHTPACASFGSPSARFPPKGFRLSAVHLCTACSALRSIPSLRSALTAFGGHVLIVRRFLYDVAPSAISSAELRLAYLYQ